ncbi:mannosylglycerate hydrolase [Listeria monocytogenes]|nr:mannosylglycerate hydrolase [Listeria monocytogenes]EBF5205808.1 mannosylglycerate hydrolase [Listeria monocytogenes]ECB9335611.1 mannosylglycerate hydrolase [Listeria monocytogenes]ECB9371112.1 mannosylglycerate hydrolase [Listeria monocytogenes]ECB9373936.1 mannosylglycerate hydrolase [Listeria monocytogenes]
MAKTKVHVIPHSHWDREWYFTSSRSTIYLVKHLKEVIETLEAKDDYHFYLMDAQSSLIEDYLRYCPEDKTRLEKLIAEKRLITGPWYTQTDQLVISQESIVRNLLYGTRIAREMGHSMAVGYVPDAFGQGGNMPQIYKEFVISKFLFWRGVADNRLKQTEFIWRGDDGTEMLAEQIPFGYYYGANIPENEAELKTYLDDQIGALEEKASTRNVYFPNGLDQAPVRKNLPELVAKFNELDSTREYQIASPETFFADLEKDVTNLPVIAGELTEGKHSRLHKSIFSTRADLKQANNEIENFLSNVLEPVLSISYSLGNRYPHNELAEIWKLMFENAAHDSIGGCNSDTTNRDVKHRYKLASDLATNLLDLNMRLISEKIEQKQPFQFTVFNPLPYEKSGVIKMTAYIPEDNFEIEDTQGNTLEYTILEKTDLTDYVLNQHIDLNPSKSIYLPEKVFLATMLVNVNSLPALGYDTIYFNLEKETAEQEPTQSTMTKIENEFYEIQLAANNSLTIHDKKAGRTYTDQMLFVENGDDGDSYNYSPPRKDLVISSEEAVVESLESSISSVNQTLTISFKLNVPYNLEERANGEKSNEMTIKTVISLRKNEELIRFDVQVANQVLSHRLCVTFATEIASKFSTADQLFAPIQRPVRLPEMDVWEAEEWQEAPISIEAMQSFVSLHDEAHGVAVMTEGVREYEIIGENYDTISLTLFRTFSHMGKTDLLYRPGRASGESIVATPDAQLLGEINATFALTLFESSFDEADIAKKAKEYLSNPPVYQMSDFLNGRLIYVYRDEEKTLDATYSLALPTIDGAIISAVKKAEDADAFITRFFNPYLQKEITIPEVFQGKERHLDESESNEKQTRLKHAKVQSYLFEK